MLPHVNCKEGDEVYIRAVVLRACSDAFQVRIEDHPTLTVTQWVPACEVSKKEDIGDLHPVRQPDLKYLDPAYNGVKCEKTSEIKSEAGSGAENSAQRR
jgi:hypothetical protein